MTSATVGAALENSGCREGFLGGTSPMPNSGEQRGENPGSGPCDEGAWQAGGRAGPARRRSPRLHLELHRGGTRGHRGAVGRGTARSASASDVAPAATWEQGPGGRRQAQEVRGGGLQPRCGQEGARPLPEASGAPKAATTQMPAVPGCSREPECTHTVFSLTAPPRRPGGRGRGGWSWGGGCLHATHPLAPISREMTTVGVGRK